VVGVVSQAGEIAACRERGHIQCLQRQDVSPEGSGGVETDNVAGEYVSDESEPSRFSCRRFVGGVTG